MSWPSLQFAALLVLGVALRLGGSAIAGELNSFDRESLESRHHWAFEPVRKVEPPRDPTGWAENPIDRFVIAKLREQNLQAVRLADKRTLIRRVYFDLIGLPPLPEEVEAFLADRSPDAYPRLVDRLLASPRYGERWGRHWMDVVRYADTAGDNADYPVPEARRYRDYIIDSFNGDKPYDQFVQEQLAGDILAKQGPPEKFAERVVGTGFIALSRRYATAPFELWHLTIEDTIETTGRAFLGLTLRCARCHDHKYDPLTREDYYALYGFFASTEYPYAGSEEFQSKNFPRRGFVPLLPPGEASPKIQEHRERIERLQADITKAEQQEPTAKQVAEFKRQLESKSKQIQEAEKIKQEVDTLKTELASIQKQHDETNRRLQQELKPLRDGLRNLQRPGLPAELPCAYAVSDGEAADVCVQVRGNPEEKGPVVKRGVPKFLAESGALKVPDGSSGRLQLAEWLAQSNHPLTARVMVNRIWQYHFGEGIVATPSNFGRRGDPPTHPELLDYLAARFVESGWSIKAMHRLILLSKTYRLSSEYDSANATRDPGNKWHWRFDRRRLDAESIRDAMLAVAGNLDLSRPGEHPFPPMNSWSWTQHNPFKAVYDSNHRSAYLMTQRIQRHPYLSLFDAPDPNTTTDVRTESTVPLQALYLMNNPFVEAQARGLARRVICGTLDTKERIRRAIESTWTRAAAAREIQKAMEYLEQYRQGLTQAGVEQNNLELESWTSYARVLLSANEFFYVD